jgi:CheY-like chemotaxis protein
MKPPKILIIDDNEIDIFLLRKALDQQGEDYELEILIDGEEALRFVRENRTGIREPHPCGILLDLHLPRYDGMAILRAIREAPALEHIRVLILSALATPQQEIEIASLGGTYRRKSSSLHDLVKLAEEIIAICKSFSLATMPSSPK